MIGKGAHSVKHASNKLHRISKRWQWSAI